MQEQLPAVTSGSLFMGGSLPSQPSSMLPRLGASGLAAEAMFGRAGTLGGPDAGGGAGPLQAEHLQSQQELMLQHQVEASAQGARPMSGTGLQLRPSSGGYAGAIAWHVRGSQLRMTTFDESLVLFRLLVRQLPVGQLSSSQVSPLWL